MSFMTATIIDTLKWKGKNILFSTVTVMTIVSGCKRKFDIYVGTFIIILTVSIQYISLVTTK